MFLLSTSNCTHDTDFPGKVGNLEISILEDVLRLRFSSMLADAT